jgi:hypothetical protein
MMRWPAALLVLAMTRAARADAPPDPAAVEAGDANLQSTAARRGIVVAASIGGGATVGFGIEDSVGRGGALSLRLGHVATPRTVITFEFEATATLHRPMNSAVQTNTDANLLVGGQYYANPSLWLRLAGGIGNYQGHQVARGGKLGDVTLTGPVMLIGGGVDLARFKWAVLGIEAASTAMVNRDGVLIVTAASLGLQFD